jgi:hypothetical protein
MSNLNLISGNAAVEVFLTDLVKFLGIDLGERTMESSSEVYQLGLKPLPPGVKAVSSRQQFILNVVSQVLIIVLILKVDLVRHHGVLVTKAGLSRILLNGANDPKSLVRAALIELYGKEALKKMSGTRSLQKHVVDAIQGNNYQYSISIISMFL